MDFSPILLSSLITVEEKGFLEKGKIWGFEIFFFLHFKRVYYILGCRKDRRRIKEYISFDRI